MFSSKMFRKIHWFVEFHRLDLLRDVIQVTTENCPSFRRKTNSPPCRYNETILFFVFANVNQQFILVYAGCQVSQRADCFLESNLVVLRLKTDYIHIRIYSEKIISDKYSFNQLVSEYLILFYKNMPISKLVRLNIPVDQTFRR